MSATLIAVVVALVLGHAVQPLAAIRRYDWYVGWVQWLSERFDADAAAPGEGAAVTREAATGRGALILLLALAPPLLVVALIQFGLQDAAWGLPGFLFAVFVLFYAWGPRDLDLDVEAALDAPDAEARRAAVARLYPDSAAPPLTPDGGSLVEAAFRCALWRWFGVLFWFLLLGPLGALAYRLVALSAQGEARVRLPQAAGATADILHRLMDWPVAQLMSLSLALVANFDAVFTAWREWHTGGARLDTGFLGAAARAGVARELAEDDLFADDATAAMGLPALAELRDAMSLIWRILLLWLALLALFVLAGWVS